jgi:predicted ATPase
VSSASSTLLKSERRRLNTRLVEVLEQRFPDVARAEPERLARHAAEAGMTAAAVSYWLKAGLQALGQSGMPEAISRLKAGLALAQTLPADEARWRLELDLEVALGKAQIATIGYAPAATGETFARAQALCVALGQPPQQLTVLHGEWTHDLLRGRLSAARARADALLAAGESRADDLRIMMGCRFQGVTAFPLGDFEKARTHLERGLALFDPARRAAYAQITLDDGRVVMLTYLAWVLSYLGATEAALHRAEESLAEAISLAHPYSMAHAMNGLAFTLLLDGRYAAASTRLAELSALTAEHGMSYYAAICQALQGRCLVGQGEVREGARVLRRAIRAYRGTDSVLYMPTFMTWLAQALGREGRIAEGLRMTAGAQALIRKTGMRFDQATTFETEAELHLLAEHPQAAATRLEKALATAAEQRTPLIERRIRDALNILQNDPMHRPRETLRTP